MKHSEAQTFDPEIDRASVGNRSPSVVNSLELDEMTMESASIDKLEEPKTRPIEEKTEKEGHKVPPQLKDQQGEESEKKSEIMPPNAHSNEIATDSAVGNIDSPAEEKKGDEQSDNETKSPSTDNQEQPASTEDDASKMEVEPIIQVVSSETAAPGSASATSTNDDAQSSDPNANKSEVGTNEQAEIPPQQEATSSKDEVPEAKGQAEPMVIDLCDGDSSTTDVQDSEMQADVEADPNASQDENTKSDAQDLSKQESESKQVINSESDESKNPVVPAKATETNPVVAPETKVEKVGAEDSSTKPENKTLQDSQSIALVAVGENEAKKKSITNDSPLGDRTRPNRLPNTSGTTESPYIQEVVECKEPYKSSEGCDYNDDTKLEIVWISPSSSLDTPGAGKTRNLVLKRRKRPLLDVSCDTEAWDNVNGSLVAKPNFKKRRDEFSDSSPSYESIPVTDESKEDWEEGILPTSSSPERSEVPQHNRRSSRARTNKSRPSKSSSRVGENYQVSFLPHPSTYDPSTEEVDYTEGNVLFDPLKAEAARKRGEKIDEFLEGKELELNVKFLMMDSLHQGDYNVKEGMAKFINSYKNKRNTFIEFSDSEQKRFNEIAPRLLGKKDFKTAAAVMKRTKECILVHYYLWKRLQKDYHYLKEERRKESDYCWQCQDGGHLIICDLCRHAFHLQCLKPPLKEVPTGDWYCMRCIHASPARLRRISGGQQLDTSSHNKPPPNAVSNVTTKNDIVHPVKDAVKDAVKKKAVLRGVHRELFSGGTKNKSANSPVNSGQSALKTAPFVPSGMVWDSKRGVWLTCDSDSQSTAKVGGSPLKSIAESSPEILHIDDDSESPRENGSFDGNQTSDSSFHSVASEEDDALSVDRAAQARRPPKPNQWTHRNPPQPANRAALFTAEKNGQARSGNTVYDIQVPITDEGLLLNIVSHPSGGVCFSGYRTPKTGGKSLAEKRQLFRGIGDRFLSIDGKNCDGKSFNEIRGMLKQHSNGQKYKYLRVLHENGKTYTMTGSKNQGKPLPNSGSNINNSGTTSTGLPASSVYGQRPIGIPQGAPMNTGINRFIPHQNQQRQMMPTVNTMAGGQMRQTTAPAHVQPIIPSQPSYPQNNPRVGNYAGGPMSHPPPNNATQQGRNVLIAAIEPMRIPDLLTFLSQRGIHTADAFLSSNSSLLATDWARLRQVPWDVALDFIGAVRLQVRQYLAQNK